MPPGKCLFNPRWLKQAEYARWLESDPGNKLSAKCKICVKSIDVSNMGEPALRSHAKGQKHQQRLEELSSGFVIRDFFQPKRTTATITAQSCEDLPTTSAASSTGRPTSTSVPSFVTKSECLHAEILWTLKVIASHYSFKSCADTQHLFAEMFPDSDIAKQFACGERKCAYLCTFGIAPYLKHRLSKKISDADGYVLLFDESLNKVTRNKQMDIHARIWDEGLVGTHYFTSLFMGHATAEDMIEHFETGTDGLNMRRLLQLSMDGPSVNWKFHRMLQTKISSTYDHFLLNVGSCGLHIVHGAFKDGASASGWQIQDVLRGLYMLFKDTKDTPARREDFIKCTESTTFPMKFCPHRWVENVPVVERALSIWLNIQKYVKQVNKGHCDNPKTVSYKTVSDATKDKIIVVKLLSFLSIAKTIQPFLTQYQTDKPMLPFLPEDLFRLIRSLMKRFLKEDVDISTVNKLVKVNLEDKDLHKSYIDVDLGFAAEKELKKIKSSSSGPKVSDREILELRMQCKGFLIKLVSKLLEKSPLKYPLTLQISCLDPRQMATNKTVCITNMKKLLATLLDANQMRGGASACDTVLLQFEEFLETTVIGNMSTFSNFDPHKPESRLDALMFESVALNQRMAPLWNVMKNLLLLVERGFSVNRQIETENMIEQTVVSERLVCDHLKGIGGLKNIEVTKEMLTYCSSARQKYSLYLDSKREEKLNAEKLAKRKHVLDTIDELKTKRKRIERDIESLTQSADKFAEKAEETGQLDFVTKSNSLRRTAKQKKQELATIASTLDERLQELKK